MLFRCIYREKNVGAFKVTVSQPHRGAGLEWRVFAEHALIGRYDRTSGGRFYVGPHGETDEEVADAALRAAESFLERHENNS